MNPKLVFLLLASVIGPMTCSAVDNATAQVGIPEPQPVPHINTTAQVGIPEPGPPKNTSTTTDKPKTSTTPLPSTTSTTIKTTTISPSTTSTTSAPPTTSTPTPTSTTTPHPSSTTEKPHPSDRKFDAFSFIGGFALAIGLVAIGFLAWKLYISRRGDMYHTL